MLQRFVSTRRKSSTHRKIRETHNTVDARVVSSMHINAWESISQAGEKKLPSALEEDSIRLRDSVGVSFVRDTVCRSSMPCMLIINRFCHSEIPEKRIAIPEASAHLLRLCGSVLDHIPVRLLQLDPLKVPTSFVIGDEATMSGRIFRGGTELSVKVFGKRAGLERIRKSKRRDDFAARTLSTMASLDRRADQRRTSQPH